jgi:hypothetical protein
MQSMFDIGLDAHKRNDQRLRGRRRRKVFAEGWGSRHTF